MSIRIQYFSKNCNFHYNIKHTTGSLLLIPRWRWACSARPANRPFLTGVRGWEISVTVTRSCRSTRPESELLFFIVYNSGLQSFQKLCILDNCKFISFTVEQKKEVQILFFLSLKYIDIGLRTVILWYNRLFLQKIQTKNITLK